MLRLQPDTLARLPADVARPRYERGALRAGIVHLGLGAFARAHLAVATEAAMAATGDLRWGIVGVSLCHPDTRDALAPQGGLYSVALRDADDDGAPGESLRVIGALLRVVVAGEDPAAVLEHIAHADTRIVSLTVTEKGYCHDPASGALRFEHADIAHDLAQPETPRSAVGMIVRALSLRQRRGRAGIALLSLDNLPANGDMLRGLVLAFADRAEPPLGAWIAAQCSFPNSMVDRIVPRTTDAERSRIGERLGLVDAWPLVAEPYFDWALQDRFVAGRPEWVHGGARFVADAAPFEQLKLRMVNGTHSTLAYLGAMAGFATIDRAIAQPALRAFIDALLRDEIAPTLGAVPGLDLDAYRRQLLRRFANPALAHATHQIAMDGSQKLPQRLLGTLRDRLDAGGSITRLALGVAAWLHYLRGVDEAGGHYVIEDPLAAELNELCSRAESSATTAGSACEAAQRRAATFTAFAPVFGTLGSDARCVAAVAQHLLSLRERGVIASVEAATAAAIP